MTPSNKGNNSVRVTSGELRRAALCLEDAIAHRQAFLHLLSPEQLLVFRHTDSKLYKLILYVTIFLHVSCAFWEPPDPSIQWKSEVSRTLVVQVQWTVFVAYMMDLLSRIFIFGFGKLLRNSFEALNVLIIVSLFFDVVIMSSGVDCQQLHRPFRACLLVIHSNELRRMTKSTVAALPGVLHVFVFITLMLLIWGACGLVLYREIYLKEHGAEGDFSDFKHAFVSLIGLLTLDNYPTLMFTAYKKSKFNFLFFGSFVWIGSFLVMNSLLAVVYKAYMTSVQKYVRDSTFNEWHATRLCPNQYIVIPLLINISTAFRITDQDNSGRISLDEFSCLMQAVKPNINEVITRFYFELCNENGDDDELDVVDFLKVTEILRATVFHTGSITENGDFVPNKSCKWAITPVWPIDVALKAVPKKVWNAPYSVVVSLPYNILSCLLVVADVVVAWIELTTYAPGWITKLHDAVFWTIMIMFACELVVRVGHDGHSVFWRGFWNQADFWILLLNLTLPGLLRIFQETTGKEISSISSIFNVLLIFRLLRILRLTKFSRSLRVLSKVYYRLNNLGVKLFAIVFAVMYVYACVGMYLWNGKYDAGKEFEDINFNSFRNSMLLLFQLTTGSDWTSLMLSGGQSVDNFYGSVIFFTSFMILVEMIILNLLFALIIDLYFQLCKKPHDRVVVHYTASGSTNIEVLNVVKKVEIERELLEEDIEKIRKFGAAQVQTRGNDAFDDVEDLVTQFETIDSEKENNDKIVDGYEFVDELGKMSRLSFNGARHQNLSS